MKRRTFFQFICTFLFLPAFKYVPLHKKEYFLARLISQRFIKNIQKINKKVIKYEIWDDPFVYKLKKGGIFGYIKYENNYMSGTMIDWSLNECVNTTNIISETCKIIDRFILNKEKFEND